ncbi:type-F conjugative transfer system pilin assembly protein TrbC [Pseudoduganella ginsengisoli]|uniref:Type-F conjugative transfer system pilin assembly protein TrbC n=1 Tax=Pseudoduganella ginsengisoli TaxID=1462440 RepID=A0A6L6PZR0_9BURK|nr:type-F conjugative transfer system pilin assembly protein TrbC [Pseudoduganella ginsengisoli]MTW02726.1 type-F conjugative transfer system pilin assembly protein TrbC [Pseudoduganella ginsengisoli]
MSLRRLAWLGVFAPLAVVCAGAVEPAGTHHIERLPQPSAGAGIDLAQVARGFDAAGVGVAPPLAGTRLIVFISLAMPEGALRRLLADGARSGAVLVLRGLEDGSIRKTVAHIGQLAGGRTGAIQIDPQAFARYGVQQVPVVVLARGAGTTTGCGEPGCAPADSFVSVAGDVSIAHALDHVVRSAPQFRADAERLRALLEP